MYLKLGNTNIKYSTDIDDFFIISEVIDSKISYEKPIFVRTSDELDIWFGDSFKERGYLKELLKSGVTLYLYKPISTKVFSESLENYINYEDYPIDNNIYPNLESIDSPKEGIVYKVYEAGGEFLDIENSCKYNKYILLYGSLVNVLELPQNINLDYSESLYNRDSLRINYNNYLGPEYTSPKYLVEDYSEVVEYDILTDDLPNLEKLRLGYETLSFDLSFNKLKIKESDYIILKGRNKERNLIWFSNNGEGFPINIATKYYNNTIEINIKNKVIEEIIKEFISILQSIGYNIITIDQYNFTIYSSFSIPCDYFFNIEGMLLSPNYRVTQNILTKYCENNGRIEFYSKVIGKDENPINIKIEDLGGFKNRITISKYNYSEIFEGYSIWFNEKDRIDYVINSTSKLVRCNLIDSYLNESGKIELYSETSSRSAKLLTGEWKLSGSIEEFYSRDMYWESFKVLMNEDVSGFIDYYLIPDINDYIDVININEDDSFFKEYLEFLEISKKLGCQILIQNSDYDIHYKEVSSISEMIDKNIIYILKEENVYFIYNEDSNSFIETTNKYLTNKYRNDFLFNYTEDLDNRLIYFYRPLKIYGNIRPGYYLYLKSLLNNTYSGTAKEIIYIQPEGDPYTNQETDLKKELSKKKSNYLEFNNQIYYYKNYQNGEIYNTTGWMRFCLGKISRELEKNKWSYLSKNIIGEILGNIKKTFERIYNSFTIIRSIEINGYEFDFSNNILNLTISTKMSDLVDNNISLDITLNYNN